jgi:hypothetical protein
VKRVQKVIGKSRGGKLELFYLYMRFLGDFCLVEPDFQDPVFETGLAPSSFTSAGIATMRCIDPYTLSLAE